MVLLLGLLVVLPCHERAGAQTAPPDFSAGFAKLVELGMPELDATAEWVASRQVDVPYAIRQRVKPFKGAGWRIGTGKEARILPLGGLEAAETQPLPTKPDIDKDLEALIAAVTKDAESDEEQRGLFEYYGDGEELMAALMLFAAQLHQTGRAEQANRLAAALFTVVPERETVIDCAVNSIAEFHYGKLTAGFFKNRDWGAYHTGLVALTVRFPRGWGALEAVGVFLPQLAKQAEGLRPQPPTLPGIELDPRALAAVAELTEPPPARSGEDGMDSHAAMPREMSRWEMEAIMGMRGGGSGGCWLLAEPTDPDKAMEATARLRALGMAAVPALAALLGDPFLTPRPNSSGGQSSVSVWDDEDGLARIYERMSRPATRGEIARQLLLGALPDPDRDLERADDGELRELALEFWRAHRAATREELALVFLREGGESQAAEAVGILAKAADARFHEALEEYFLTQDPAHGAYDLVRAYLQIRKQAAKPFFQKYAELVRSQAPEVNDEDISYGSADYRLRQMGGVDKLLKSLAALVNDKEPRAVAVEIAKGKPDDAEAAIRELRQTMAGISPLKQLHALLEGANAAKDPAVRGHFLMTSLSIRWPDDDAESESPADQRRPRRKVSAAEERVWRKLMGDQRETKGFPLADSYGGELPFETIGDMARAAFENSIMPGGVWRLVRAAGFMDLTPLELLRETVAARLDGKPVPVLPDSEKVTPERLEAIVAEAGKLQPAAILPYIKTLSADERAAWAEWLEDPEDGPEKPPSVEALKWFVQARRTEGFRLPPPAREVTTFEPGFLLDADWLLARCKIMAEKPGEFSPYCMLLGEGAGGLEVVELLLKPAPAAPAAEKPAGEGHSADGDGDAEADEEADEEDEDAEDEAREVWQLVFGGLREALESHPGAIAAVSLRGSVQDDDGVVVLITKEQTLTLPKEEGHQDAGDVGAALRDFLSEREPGSLILCALARADMSMIINDGDGADDSTGDTPEADDSGAADGPPPAYTEPIPK